MLGTRTKIIISKRVNTALLNLVWLRNYADLTQKQVMKVRTKMPQCQKASTDQTQ